MNDSTTPEGQQHANNAIDGSASLSLQKIQTRNDDGVTETVCSVAGSRKRGKHRPPQSRKELRAEKKAVKKASASAPDALRKKERRLVEARGRRKEKRLAQITRLRRARPAPGDADEARSAQGTHDPAAEAGDVPGTKAPPQEEDAVANIYNHLFDGTGAATGTTALRMGVRYVDVVEGGGPVAEEGNLVRVRYRLTGRRTPSGGGGSAAVVAIESASSFYFRLGVREVIPGWDIGVAGMREGGRRHLIVPPAAGYGTEDIGAGPGATLFFDITLLKVRGR